MDGKRFDDLSRKLATGMSRRRALKGFTAGVLGALGLRSSADAQVTQVYCGNTFCATNPGICKPGCVCCTWYNSITNTITNSRCMPPNQCTGQVSCAPGSVYDPARGCVAPCANAGACPQPAAGSCKVATCSSGGICGQSAAPNNTACGSGKTCCSGNCVANTTTTTCGACGNACTANQVCSSGSCTCPNETCNGACCAANQVCIGGVCKSRAGDGQACDTTGANDCQAGLTCCNGTCRNLQTNAGFCGTCTTACSGATPYCVGGACVACRTLTDCPVGTASNCEGARTCNAGTCGFAPALSSTICRPSTGSCDPAETCTGTTLGCPADAKIPTGQPGTCTGGQVCCGGACTPLNTTANCRACSNACDPNEICGATDCTCPNVTCGSACCAAGEVCIGGSCRPRAGEGGTCDSGENSDCDGNLVCCGTTCTTLGTTANCASCGNACTGATPYCVGGACVACRTPTDCPEAAPGTCEGARTCSAAGVCGFAPATEGTLCRASLGACDLAEFCTGDSIQCPVDEVKPANTVCRASAGPCDIAEVCNGVSKACPTDAFHPSSVVCRAAAGDCDLQATCTGSSANCPPNAFKSSSTVCRAASGPCDVAENCTGSSAACPADGVAGTNVVCRTVADDCDVPENCDGVSKTCPTTDAKKADNAVCGANSDQVCCGGICCSGSTPACNTTTHTCVLCAPGSTQSCYTGPADTAGVGICRTGTQTCNAAGSGYGACVGEVVPTQEVCDGLDNDCDGVVDDGIVGIGAPCNTGNLGICAAGTTACSGGVIVCNQNLQPTAEICNGLDDDCDGTIDNGAPCPAGQSCITGACVCTPETAAQACARQGRVCGTTTNFCGATVSCGICPTGSTCNGAGACIVNCGAAGSTNCTGTIGTQGSCCSGLTCGEGNVCVEPCTINRVGGCVCTSSTQCPTTGDTCCRPVGSGAQCKPGGGGCIA